MLLWLSGSSFLGWSLGANHGGNLFGPAVGARMIRFSTAASLCGVLVVVGAVCGGAGTTATVESVGAVNAPGGAFVTALAVAATTTLMCRSGLPISTSQAVIGAVVGWNAFAHAPTGFASLATIVATWIVAPCVAGAVSAAGYTLLRALLLRSRLHLLTVDALTRTALIAVSGFGAYSLGANNIANVVGMFSGIPLFHPVTMAGLSFSPAQQLLFVGGLSMALGIITYSRRVVHTVGSDLLKLSPIAALVVLFAHGLVLFLFSSQELGRLLHSLGLPAIPLVPISSSQAVTGAVLGIGLTKRARGLRLRVLRGIAVGWVTAPVLAGVTCFVALFVAQNVFELQVRASDRLGGVATYPETLGSYETLSSPQSPQAPFIARQIASSGREPLLPHRHPRLPRHFGDLPRRPAIAAAAGPLAGCGAVPVSGVEECRCLCGEARRSRKTNLFWEDQA